MSYSASADTILKNNRILRQRRSDPFTKAYESSSNRQISKEQNLVRMNKADSIKTRKIAMNLLLYFVVFSLVTMCVFGLS